MNTTQEQIESTLRAAPRPAPPAGLKERLNAQVRLPAARPALQSGTVPPAPAGWLRRWWPVLIPASVSLACAVGLTVQQVEIHHLKRSIEDLSHNTGMKAPVPVVPPAETNSTPSQTDAAAGTQQEIARLKALASQLTAEVGQLEQLQAENAKLRGQLAAPPTGALTPEETDALAKARERAEAIACLNNLKQLGLSARTWAIDNGDICPPNLLDMTNEMSTPKILACPSDRKREAVLGWASYTPANCSYEYLAPSAPDGEPDRVLFRCPIHGSIVLCDGSAFMGVGKEHPEWLVQRDGKLYYERPAQQPTPAPQPVNPPAAGSSP
jgi:hypothetical protein